MLQLTDYFGKYAHVHPDWVAFLRHCESEGLIASSGFSPHELEGYLNKSGEPALIQVDETNFPRLYKAARAECGFRGIPLPAIYVDTTGEGSGGRAYADRYAFHIERDLIPFLSDKELRWIVAHEIKHLYQGGSETPEESLEAEDYSDRAAVESTDYETAVSFFQKLAAFKIGYKTGVSPDVLNVVLPAFLSSHFPFSISANDTDLRRLHIANDPWHRSPYSRMRVMREHSAKLYQERACEHS